MTPKHPIRPPTLALIAVGGCLLACCAAVGAPAERLLQGAACLSSGDLEGARELFAQEAQADRLNAVALAGAGAADILSGRTAPARNAFESALILAPSLPCAHIGAGAALYLSGDYSAAMSHYHAALVGGPRRPAAALAAEACAACALGLYEAALQDAQTALATEPDQPLARYVFAAAALARGDPRPAAQLDGGFAPTGASLALPVALPSCLLSPGAAYWQRSVADRQAALGPGAALAPSSSTRPEPMATRPADDFRLASPREGAVVEGSVTVELAVADKLEVDHVIVLVNDSFAGITSVRPYRIPLDTRLFAGGVTEIRAEGRDRRGVVIRSAQVAVEVQNGNRTLAPEETAARHAVGELLEEMLFLQVSPMSPRQLAGHGLLQLGQPERAAGAFESAYACDADTPGLRGDLLAAYRALSLPSAPTAPEVYGLPAGRNTVALTFDDGPHPLITPWILDQLDKESVKATFFLVGKQATLYPELVREIRRRGHQIGSHSYAHYSLRHFTPQECEQDLVKSRLAIREACGETVTLFRPPGGYYDATVKAAAGALGFTTVFWSCNITSYPSRDGRRIAADIARQVPDGGIILLHNGEDETLDTLPYLIPELRRQGATFVTILPREAALTSGSTPAEGGG